MKILTWLTLFFLWTNSDKKSYKVKPGIGLDDIVIGKSTINEVLSYGNLEFEIDSGTSISCGEISSCEANFIKIHSKTNGITFTFSTPCLKDPEKHKLKLVSIYLHETSGACLDNGICINKSTYKDVIKIMGKIKGNNNDQYLFYYEDGIELNFNEEGILYSVEIYHR